MSGGDPPIIIQGGSVTLQFDVTKLWQSGTGKYGNDTKVIKMIEITGADIQNYAQTPTGNNVTVKITYGDP